MSQAEKDVVDASETKKNDGKQIINWGQNRINFRNTFILDSIEYMSVTSGYTKTQVIDILKAIDTALEELDRIDVIGARTTINKITIAGDLTQDIKDKMIQLIDTFLNNE